MSKTEPLDPRLARKERRQLQKREQILAKAAELLVEAGLPGLTIPAVAERADLSKPAVYYYFPSKEALLAALVVEHLRAETHALLAAVEPCECGVDALIALLRGYVEHHRRELARFRSLSAAALGMGEQKELLEREIYPLSWSLMGLVEKRLSADRDAGRVHADVHPRRIANLAFMLAHGIVSVLAAMDASGGSLRASVKSLCDEAEATLRRACAPANRAR